MIILSHCDALTFLADFSLTNIEDLFFICSIAKDIYLPIMVPFADKTRFFNRQGKPFPEFRPGDLFGSEAS